MFFDLMSSTVWVLTEEKVSVGFLRVYSDFVWLEKSVFCFYSRGMVLVYWRALRRGTHVKIKR